MLREMKHLLLPLLAAITLPTAAIEKQLLYGGESDINTAKDILLTTKIGKAKTAWFYYIGELKKIKSGDLSRCYRRFQQVDRT